MSEPTESQIDQFMALFSGRIDAYGTGRGQWIKERPKRSAYREHLAGRGPGLGIAPLLDDGTVRFVAIDLDEPDFDAARTMASFLPGPSFIERSRSGNAHVWVFFSEPIEAWVPRGILKEACLAAGKGAVEVFPKQDRLLEGMLGNYINLPYHGENRPVLWWSPDSSESGEYTLDNFLLMAWHASNDPEHWRKRAGWLQINPPGERLDTAEWGTAPQLHMCCEWIIANRDEVPIDEGGRHIVFFNIAKMLLNYSGFDQDEAWKYLNLVNDSATPPLVESELRRTFNNALRGRYTSTGCDDPVMSPYVHPDCPIAQGR